jgi:D-alanyl-lipoteichoic acid acyltransferase DltB (MBOAT superfamily)
MLFNSIEFTIFLPLVFFIYWFIVRRNLKLQNAFVVVASYVFYGWWDWRFLSLLMISTVMDYALALSIASQDNERRRKAMIGLSLLLNLGMLGFFKYFNFFIENFAAAYTFFGVTPSLPSLQIVLPVGISFYTFQSLSYTIDVYRRRMEPTRDPIAFAAFVSFFPQLVAGPIERATHLLPQFYKERDFSYSQSIDGMRQMLWGFFKKVVIADNCAEYANLIFNNSDDYSGPILLLGALFFTFQIYGDFSGYSDIAIGSARLFGFELMRNFSFPYFSRDIAEFWRRWHISLSTWFRDYVYIPLGGSRGNTLFKVRNTMIIFLVSGFWHGANWTFIFWGLLHALYFLPVLLSGKNRVHLDIAAQGKIIPTPNEFIRILVTFMLTVFAWIFFRAENLTHAFSYVENMFSGMVVLQAYHEAWKFIVDQTGFLLPSLLTVFILAEWAGREHPYPIAGIHKCRSRFVRWSVYYIILFVILFAGGQQQDFIYFQF